MCSSCDVPNSATSRGRGRFIAPLFICAVGVVAAVVALLSFGGRDGRATAPKPEPLLLSSPDDVVSGRALDLQHGSSLIVIWAAACPPCERQARALTGFARRHPGARLVAIDLQDSAGHALTIARRYRWPGSVLLDPKANIAAHLRLRSLPATLFVSEGRILAAPVGVLTATSLERTYQSLLRDRRVVAVNTAVTVAWPLIR